MGGATLYIETVNDRPLYSALKHSQPRTLISSHQGFARLSERKILPYQLLNPKRMKRATKRAEE